MRQPTQKLDVHETCVLLCDLAFFERDQSRNAADAEAGCDRRLLVDVDLGEAGARFELFAARSKIGAIARHGPHQGAQKSTMTGPSLRSIVLSKVFAVNATGSPVNSLDLQTPQIASAAGRSDGTRLTAEQCGQTV